MCCVRVANSIHSALHYSCLEPSMMDAVDCIYRFSLEWEDSDPHQESIKWTTGNQKHETAMSIIVNFELALFIVHCLAVMHRIGTQVNHTNNCFLLFQIVFLQILSLPLWKTVLVDHPMSIQHVAGFHVIQHLTKTHATNNCHHKLFIALTNQIQWTCKPTFAGSVS
jgi:hypothetical protein